MGEDGERRIRSALFLTGALAFGYNAATALHEVGHVLAAWSTGGRVVELRIHPFADSFVSVAPDRHPLFTHLGGFLLPLFVGAGLIVRALRSPTRTPPILTALAVSCLATTGIYLLLGALGIPGDVGVLTALGIPRLVLAGVGALALGASIAGLVFSLRRFGLDGEDSELVRAIVLGGAVIAYAGVMLLYQWHFTPQSLRFWASAASLALLAMGGVALLSRVVERAESAGLIPSRPVTNRDLGWAWGLAVAIIVLELSQA